MVRLSWFWQMAVQAPLQRMEAAGNLTRCRGRLHWGIQPRKPLNPQYANKTISFGFNDPAVRRNFLRRALCGEEGKYADE